MKTYITVAVLCLLTLSCNYSTPIGSEGGYILETKANNGSITKSPDKAKYLSGDTVTLTAISNIGYNFLNWGGDASGTNTTSMVTMDRNKIVTADFFPETIVDVDSNVYHTVKIGNQVWTTENLRTTKFKDGSPIPFVTDNDEWKYLNTPGHCYYNNTINTDTIKMYGALYNWLAVETEKLALDGWHVPDSAAWSILQNYLIANGYNWDGTTSDDKIAKSMAAMTSWNIFNEPGTIGNDLTKNNRSGFTALPAGDRSLHGIFRGRGTSGDWWSATELNSAVAYHRYLLYHQCSFFVIHNDKKSGFSVRLIKD
jgi:uncharacterized protein (TIGR02145 family)